MFSDPARLDLFVYALMYFAMLWWVGRGLSWQAKLGTTIVTFALIAIVVTVERAWH
jgi:hypothetical protein